MKTTLLIVLLSLLLPLGLEAQSPVRASDQKLEDESPVDPYLRNAWDNKKTTAPYFDLRTAGGDPIVVSIRTIQVNVDELGLNIVDDAANEPSLAIDIEDTLSIAIGWRQFDNIASNFRQAGWAYSTDGGLSWSKSTIDPGVFRSDPVLDYDLQGNFYYNSLTPFPDWECDVYKSIDGGASWDAGVYAYGGDKQWMAIDRTAGEGSGNIYANWTASYSACIPGNFTRSTDGNLSYESCDYIEAEPYYGMPAIDADGIVYVVGGGDVSSLTVSRSLNAKTPGATIVWEDAVDVELGGYLGGWGSVNPEGLIGQANIDIDRSGGPGDGNVYVLASVIPYSGPDEAGVAFAKSTDGGLTWSDPIWINDEAGEGNTHWFGTMSVAPNGRIDAVWLDTRDGGGTDHSALYYSYSLDQGETWSENIPLSDTFDPHLGYPQQNKMGDYFDMSSDDHGAHLAWANTFNGEQDVYYSRIFLTEPATVGVDAQDAWHPVISPNPGAGVFVVTGVAPATEITVLNLVGEALQEWNAASSKTTIDITHYAAGVYFLKFKNADGQIFTERIIKN